MKQTAIFNEKTLGEVHGPYAVSYTHLDVYKRQTGTTRESRRSSKCLNRRRKKGERDNG